MNLLCTEQVVLSDSDSLLTVHMENRVIHTACKDPTFLTDRCLENLLKAEEKNLNHCNESSYLSQQKDITPAMRKIVAEWMLEVCFFLYCQVIHKILYMYKTLVCLFLKQLQNENIYFNFLLHPLYVLLAMLHI